MIKQVKMNLDDPDDHLEVHRGVAEDLIFLRDQIRELKLLCLFAYGSTAVLLFILGIRGH